MSMTAENDSKANESAAKDQRFSEQSSGEENTGFGLNMLAQDESIVPEVADGMVEKVAMEVYGLKVVRCTQLNSYADKNYHIRVSPSESSNPHVTSLSPDGYVMRVVNSMETQRPEFFYAQMELMDHVRRHGINTQEAVRTLSGEFVAFYQFPPPSGQGDGKTHAVLLRTFLVGDIIYDLTLTRDLCYKLGTFLGCMTKALESFQHPLYDTFDTLWSLNNIPKLAEYAHIITDVDDRRVVDDVIAQFSSCVLPKRSELRAGFIHGDPNEQNILVQRKSASSPSSVSASASAADNPDEYVISGILDFQESARTHPLYDLGMMIGHVSQMATTFDPLEVGGHILAGYTSMVELPELEASLLRVCAAARLVQLLVVGACSHSLDPTNEYLLTLSKDSWRVLHALWDTPADEVNRMWADIQQSYKEKKKEG